MLMTSAEEVGRIFATVAMKFNTLSKQREELAGQLSGVISSSQRMLSELGIAARRSLTQKPNRKRRKMSAATRRKMATAAKKRWAARKKANKKPAD